MTSYFLIVQSQCQLDCCAPYFYTIYVSYFPITISYCAITVPNHSICAIIVHYCAITVPLCDYGSLLYHQRVLVCLTLARLKS